MAGRIKTKLLIAKLDLFADQKNSVLVCPICDREIPAAQRDAHHLIPRSQGGKTTEFLHRICHRQIHALFTETELARQLNTIEALKSQDELKPFIRWIKKKPNNFFEKTRKSQRLKSM